MDIAIDISPICVERQELRIKAVLIGGLGMQPNGPHAVAFDANGKEIVRLTGGRCPLFRSGRLSTFRGKDWQLEFQLRDGDRWKGVAYIIGSDIALRSVLFNSQHEECGSMKCGALTVSRDTIQDSRRQPIGNVYYTIPNRFYISDTQGERCRVRTATRATLRSINPRWSWFCVGWPVEYEPLNGDTRPLDVRLFLAPLLLSRLIKGRSEILRTLGPEGECPYNRRLDSLNLCTYPTH